MTALVSYASFSEDNAAVTPRVAASRRADPLSIDAQARSWVARLEYAEARRSGTIIPFARAALARRLGVAPGTLENIRNGRIKGLRHWIAERIRAAVIRELELEILRLEHDLFVARQSGAGAGSDEILAATASLEAARLALTEGSRPG